MAFIWCFWVGYQIWTTPITYGGSSFSEISYLGAIPLFIPILITLMATWSIFKFKIADLVVATLLLLIFWLLASFSIGWAYTPSVILLVFVSFTNLIVLWLKK